MDTDATSLTSASRTIARLLEARAVRAFAREHAKSTTGQSRTFWQQLSHRAHVEVRRAERTLARFVPSGAYETPSPD